MHSGLSPAILEAQPQEAAALPDHCWTPTAAARTGGVAKGQNWAGREWDEEAIGGMDLEWVAPIPFISSLPPPFLSLDLRQWG